MAPKPKVIEQRSQATPFAEKFLEHMMQSFTTGYATPLQRNLGSSIEKMLGTKPFDMTKEFAALNEMFGNQQKMAHANLGERFSMGGNRYGSAAATGAARLDAEMIPAFEAMMYDKARGNYNDARNAKLAALGIGSDFSSSAFAPFVQLALSGINPDQIFMTENPWLSGAKVAAGLAEGAGSFMTGLKG